MTSDKKKTLTVIRDKNDFSKQQGYISRDLARKSFPWFHKHKHMAVLFAHAIAT